MTLLSSSSGINHIDCHRNFEPQSLLRNTTYLISIDNLTTINHCFMFE